MGLCNSHEGMKLFCLIEVSLNNYLVEKTDSFKILPMNVKSQTLFVQKDLIRNGLENFLSESGILYFIQQISKSQKVLKVVLLHN